MSPCPPGGSNLRRCTTCRSHCCWDCSPTMWQLLPHKASRRWPPERQGSPAPSPPEVRSRSWCCRRSHSTCPHWWPCTGCCTACRRWSCTSGSCLDPHSTSHCCRLPCRRSSSPGPALRERRVSSPSGEPARCGSCCRRCWPHRRWWSSSRAVWWRPGQRCPARRCTTSAGCCCPSPSASLWSDRSSRQPWS